MAPSVPQGAPSLAVPAVGPVVELPTLLTPVQQFQSAVQVTLTNYSWVAVAVPLVFYVPGLRDSRRWSGGIDPAGVFRLEYAATSSLPGASSRKGSPVDMSEICIVALALNATR